jgi:hypothetical protein
MSSFAKRIYIDQYGEFDFVFTPIYRRDKVHVVIKVLQKKHKICQFTMLPVLHYWMIAEAHDLPVWIGGIEQDLEKLIKQNYSLVS